MEKAYSIKELAVKLKGRGLDVAEEAAIIVAEEVFQWLEESAKLSSTPFDDVALLVYPKLKEFALKQADKIDGVEG